MNNEEENLKPCPFCGGWSDFGITEDGDNCVVCNCCFVSSESFKTEQEAREAWNKREGESMGKQPDVVKFDGVMYAREPQFSLRVNGNSSMLCQTEEDCGYENAIIEFSDVLVELVKVYASYDGENFSYQHPIKIVSKSNIREDGS